MSEHNWNLKGGTVLTFASGPGDTMALFQCENCNLSATKRLTNRHSGDSSVIQKPDVEAECE